VKKQTNWRKKMSKKWEGWVIRKQYFKVQVEADTWEDAQDVMLSTEVNIEEPDEIDWDVYDIEEITT
jgi:hypothetical protein